ncbi:MAG: TonB-dependent receptor [Lentimicrobium sp.]|jgi:outer membrane receptor protein involved in Fe transport|nr:TonB-dependent receptor [Lentimicrobium sp.]
MLNRHFFSFLLIFSFTFIYAFGQPAPGNATKMAGTPALSGKLTGRLVDEATKHAVEYGSVALFRQKDSVLTGGTISNAKGQFTIDNIAPGRYFIRVQFMGFEDMVVKGIMITPKTPSVDLGELALKASATAISGVEVTAEREMMINNLDKKIINVDKTIAAIGGSAVDVMQTIPSVTVDVDGNLSLRGSQNITILVDGKPSGLAELSSGDLLQQIPASSIQSIEIVTNPSVRYDPEGTSGIINIVLKKRSLQGLNGQVSLTGGTNGSYNTSLNLNYRKDRINVFAGYDNRVGTFKGRGTSLRTTNVEDFTSELNQKDVYEFSRNMHNLNTGIDYKLNDLNTLTFNFQLRDMNFDNDGTTTSLTTTETSDTMRYFNRTSNSARHINSLNYTLSYKREFTTKGKELTADFMVIDNNMQGDQDINQNEIRAPEFPLIRQSSKSRNSNFMYMAQANFVYPRENGSRIETGFKSTIKNLSMRNELAEYSSTTDNWVINPQANNDFDYFEQIHAAYGIYSASLKKFKYQLGLRAEQLISDSDLLKGEDSFDLSYLSWFPSVHIAFEQSEKQQWALSYSRRISRPHNRQLNPYVDYSDSLNIRYGNPKLKPEFINSFELGWSTFVGKNSLNASLFFRHTEGLIERVTTLGDAGVTYTTYENLNNGYSYGIELIGNREFAKWFKANLNLSYFQNVFEGSDEFNIARTESWQWTSKLNMNFNVAKSLMLSAAVYYNSPRTFAQEKRDAMYWADISARYDFMKGKASLSLRISDIFDTRIFKRESWGEGFRIVSENIRESRVGYIGFSYRINNYKRQRERDMQNGDSMEMEEF